MTALGPRATPADVSETVLELQTDRDQLLAALRQVARRRTAWLSIGGINNVAEIRVERELFEAWIRLVDSPNRFPEAQP